MNEETLIRAYTMRIRGYTWKEIAAALHYDTDTARRAVVNSIRIPYRKYHVVYPAIDRAIRQKYNGSLKAAAEAAGLTYSTARNILGGITNPSEPAAAAIAKAVGLDVKTAFRREQDQ